MAVSLRPTQQQGPVQGILGQDLALHLSKSLRCGAPTSIALACRFSKTILSLWYMDFGFALSPADDRLRR
jgi:hypothetical protein